MLNLVIKVNEEGTQDAFLSSNTLVENIKHMKQKWKDMTLLIECHGSFASLYLNVTLKSSALSRVRYVVCEYLLMHLATLIFYFTPTEVNAIPYNPATVIVY